ncbi:hypothetical protein, partial [Aeromicrobium phoceense]|uniref:hypothetical protein n=1 Tax=Aeromicrobium phoceense TaxID=2754045 RepID=UPI0028AA8092
MDSDDPGAPDESRDSNEGLEPDKSQPLDAALADAAREAVQSPDVLEAIDHAARRQDLGAGVLAGLTGRPTSAATRAVDAALADAAREAVQSPDVLEAIDHA